MSIDRQRRDLPDGPGVYLFYGPDDELLYVGKAKRLRSRVNQHFQAPAARWAKEAERLDCLVTDSELEALVTERNYISAKRPRYNVRLRNDRSYPYIAVSLDEEYPRIYLTREKRRVGRAYFGPFSSAKRARELLDLVGKLFRYRTCEGSSPGRATGNPCLDYYIKRCDAPCVDYISCEDYRAQIDQAMAFLEGRHTEVENAERTRMAAAAGAHNYELAAIHRDRLEALEGLAGRRSKGRGIKAADVIGVALEGADAAAEVLQVRDGLIFEHRVFHLVNPAELALEEVAEEFVSQYYAVAPLIPPLVITGSYLEGAASLLSEDLSRESGRQVQVSAARRGERRRLHLLAERNASLGLGRERLRHERELTQRVDVLAALQATLKLERLPLRIEGYDISNLGAENGIGSMVVFEGGLAKKSDYRYFRIRGSVGRNGPDDYADLKEVIGRRVAAFIKESGDSPFEKGRDTSFASLPDLVLIDGGKGQLAVAIRALQPMIERGTRVISIAKRLEEIFTAPGTPPLLLDHSSEELRLFQRVRDEAHRFALTQHRRRRSKQMTKSLFDDLPGVGKARRKVLIGHFKDADQLMAASAEDIGAAGLPARVAQAVYEHLHAR